MVEKIIIKKGDIIIAVIIIALAIIISILYIIGSNDLPDDKKLYAVVTISGKSNRFALSKDIVYKPEHTPLNPVIVIKDGFVFVESSNCRDKICIKTGKISKPGQIIVCVPARLTVKIITEDVSGYEDFIAG